MSYRSKDLSVGWYANGFTMWHYTTADAESVVREVGYFNDASTMFRAGDVILANTNTDGDIDAVMVLVSSVKCGVVTIK